MVPAYFFLPYAKDSIFIEIFLSIQIGYLLFCYFLMKENLPPGSSFMMVDGFLSEIA